MISRELLKIYIIERMKDLSNENFSLNSNKPDYIQDKLNSYYLDKGAYQELKKLLSRIDDSKFDE